jgi:hypothetical protein
MEGNKLLEIYLQKYPSLKGIVLTDREGIAICQAYEKTPEMTQFFEKYGYMIFTAAFTQGNGNLAKLKQKQCKALTSYYDTCVVHQENWDAVTLNIFGKKDSNMDQIYKTCKELKQVVFEVIKPIVEKL